MKAYCFSSLVVIALVPATGRAQKMPAGAAAITTARLRNYLSFLASDATEGRATPSRGLDVAADFIRSHLERIGVRPGADGSWFQRIPLRRSRIDSGATWAQLGGQRFQFGDDFVVNVFPGAFTGPMVYVGNGWVIKSKNIDAYAGLDVRDKIAIVAETGLPAGLTSADLQGAQGQDWEPPQPALRRRGAKAMITVPSFGPLLEWRRRVRDGAEFGIVSFGANTTTPPIAVIRPSLGMFQMLFEGERVPASVVFNRAAAGDPVPSFPLSPGKQLTLQVTARVDSLSTQNVIGMLEGSDASLKSEYVVLSAHYDHLGIGAPINGDSIYNGADDDASGSAALMAIAEAFAAGPRPRRSVLFIWHCGEEERDAGSRYFVAHPTVPLNQIVADLNMDMIGRTRQTSTDTTKWSVVRPNEVYVIGSRRVSRELGDISDAVNRSLLQLSFNYRFDAPDDPNQLFQRSDQYSYAEKGIPAIFYYTGDHEDYHQPSDSFDKIDYDNMQKIARTVHATALELANRPRRPRLDVRQ